MRSILLTILVIVSLGILTGGVLAETPLPASNWYAVVWVEDSDTLHWVNANGEQASVDRPQLAGEISQAQTRLHISPNGQYLVVISPLDTGREGIGFYDLESGQFVQVHESQPNEVFVPVRHNPFGEFSGQVAFALKNNSTGAWRIILFESATGNVIQQLQYDDNILPQGTGSNTNVSPSIAQVNVDEAINALEVRFHVLPDEDVIAVSYPSFIWQIPAGNNAPAINPDNLNINPYAGFDINPVTGEVVYAYFNTEFGNAPTSQAANTINVVSGDVTSTVASNGGGVARLPKWLNNGAWIGYYGTNGAFAPHWTVMTANGQSALPLSPEIIDVYHVNGGYLTKHTGLGRLNYVTALNAEAFAEPMGATIFQPGTAFAVVYSTPANTAFQLASVGDTNNEDGDTVGLDVVVGVAVAGDNSCGTAPPARLTAGDSARVTFTDGTNLRVRTAPAGDYIMEIPEGTPMTILEGPVCADGYQWYRMDLGNGTGGWSAEGDTEFYYIEPYNIELNDQLGLAPTSTPQLGIAVAPTSTPPQLILVDQCTSSPQSRLSVGMTARTIQQSGTLAMRINLSDATPTYQIPSGINVIINDGPQCREEIRMWQVTTTVNGQAVLGWIAEGFGNNYYLEPN